MKRSLTVTSHNLRRKFGTYSWQSAKPLTGVQLSGTIERFDVDRPRYTGPLQACILDWSGTTADQHVLAPAVVFVEVFNKHGVPISMKEARGPMGLRKDLHIAQILEIPEVRQRWIDTKGEAPSQSTVDALFADFVPMQCECLFKYTDLIPGTAETVQILKNDLNLKIGSTTGFTEVMVDILLADAKKQGYEPDFSCAGDSVPNNMGFRPSPFMVYHNLVHLGVWPVQSVVKVDDTVSGVGEGLSAGCWSVGLSGLSNYTDVDSIQQWAEMSEKEKNERMKHSREILRTSGAHYVADSIRELPAICRDINERLAKGDSPSLSC